MISHKTGTREQRLAARNELLAKGKELTRWAGQLTAERRELLRAAGRHRLPDLLGGTMATARPRVEFMMLYYVFPGRAPFGRNEGTCR